ncbi:PREDICTED: transcription factor bHLH128-like isoform X2 [Lupinus angustifolius]|uniref:transcription factor bHLH128-like isoform X2 n=1 Tax=Lupinus angustifolius TaxID=3871 RepID=UPI00092EFD73|nr:PREDICTED: transcription factor bHLH128-like isoform X2 [Lupinus angustifolius]
MYSSSSSSSSQTGLTRYASAPSSLLTTAVDAVISAGSHPLPPQYFSGESSEPNFQALGGGGSSSNLIRQKSSPAGFLNHLATTLHHPDNAGFTITRGASTYSSHGHGISNSGHAHTVSRLKTQLSFTGQDSLSQISEVSENIEEGTTSDNGHHRPVHSYATTSFGMEPWDNSNSIVFSAPPTKRSKNMDGDILNCLNALESQFSLPQTTLEMATVENLLHIPEDSVPCKIRAKRGCATHPRSIAERERRTRISGKLKKLQDLVPNMDKQTSYSDMLDLAVQHIKGLQSQVQKLHNELENCTCGCKESM